MDETVYDQIMAMIRLEAKKLKKCEVVTQNGGVAHKKRKEGGLRALDRALSSLPFYIRLRPFLKQALGRASRDAETEESGRDYRLVIMSPVITKHDAVSNDAEAMYRILNGQFPCAVYADAVLTDGVRRVYQSCLKKVLQNEDALVIYHHSIYWGEGEKLLKNCRCKLLFKYHNITPGAYFEQYNDGYAAQGRSGRSQTKRLAEQHPAAVWMADSLFNAGELAGLAKGKVYVCPPFSAIEKEDDVVPDGDILSALKANGKINLLFVSRIAPNKGHLFLLEIVKAYCANYDKNILLHIVGKPDDRLSGYAGRIKAVIDAYGLAAQVRFTGEVDDRTVAAYYKGSDFFVCASEHEGFCVPILEAQCLGLPVIARRSSAVGETAGKNQVVLAEDPREYAAAIRLLYDHSEFCAYLRQAGYENYRSRFRYEILKKNFCACVQRCITEH